MNPAAKTFAKFAAPLVKSNDANKLAARVWSTVTKVTKSEESAEDALSMATLRILSNSIAMTEATLLLMCFQVATDVVRSEKRQARCEELSEDITVDSTDENAGLDLDKLVQALGRMHPRAAEWAKAVVAERPMTELAKDWDVTPVAVNRFQNHYMGRMQEVASKYR